MKAIGFQPLIHLYVLERLFLIDVAIGGENMYVVMILEPINKIHNRPYGATRFESGRVPVAENQQCCFFSVQ